MALRQRGCGIAEELLVDSREQSFAPDECGVGKRAEFADARHDALRCLVGIGRCCGKRDFGDLPPSERSVETSSQAALEENRDDVLGSVCLVASPLRLSPVWRENGQEDATGFAGGFDLRCHSEPGSRMRLSNQTLRPEATSRVPSRSASPRSFGGVAEKAVVPHRFLQKHIGIRDNRSRG